MINFIFSFKFICFIGIIIGLVLFILGTKIISSGFKESISSKIKLKLNNVTSSKLSGVLIGIVITSLLQSSSATTIIIISLVHGNLINIYQAAPIIMGANIGTTITAQLVSLNFGNITPYVFFIGLCCMIFFRKTSNPLMNIVIGMTCLFLGTEVMSLSISSLGAQQFFADAITSISNNKLLPIALGCAITTTIQSSSAGIAILQVMASNNIITVVNALPIMLGQNIGTCANALIGSLATNKAGKQAAVIHVTFNVLGVFIFYFFTELLYKSSLLLSPSNPSKQIANAHTIFNVSCTILLLPFSSYLVKIAKKIIRD